MLPPAYRRVSMAPKPLFHGRPHPLLPDGPGWPRPGGPEDNAVLCLMRGRAERCLRRCQNAVRRISACPARDVLPQAV